MPHGEHHINQRKRVHIQNQPYPHPDKRIRFVDDLAMVASVAMPLSAIPQIYTIYIDKMTVGVSLWMWIFYSIACLVMLLYGIVHKAKAIIVLNVAWIIVNAVIIAGVLMYP